MAGTRKVFQMKRGGPDNPLHSKVREDISTGESFRTITGKINVLAATGIYYTDISFPYDITLMGGGFPVGGENDSDKISFIVAPGLPYEARPVDSVEMKGFAGCAYSQEVGGLKVGGSLIPANFVIRLEYENINGGVERTFICRLEFVK